jgi:hypothetical protein
MVSYPKFCKEASKLQHWKKRDETTVEKAGK